MPWANMSLKVTQQNKQSKLIKNIMIAGKRGESKGGRKEKMAKKKIVFENKSGRDTKMSSEMTWRT